MNKQKHMDISIYNDKKFTKFIARAFLQKNKDEYGIYCFTDTVFLGEMTIAQYNKCKDEAFNVFESVRYK